LASACATSGRRCSSSDGNPGAPYNPRAAFRERGPMATASVFGHYASPLISSTYA
jgi:hypothetical protein